MPPCFERLARIGGLIALVVGCSAPADDSPTEDDPPVGAVRDEPPAPAPSTEDVEAAPPAAEPVVEPAPSCRALGDSAPATPIRSRRLQRYASLRYDVDAVWSDFSVRRVGERLRVRWWLEERDCALATELVRVGDVVVLRETADPRSRCGTVGATLVETSVPLSEDDRRLCVPGRDVPISLDDLARWDRDPSPPDRRGPGTPGDEAWQ